MRKTSRIVSKGKQNKKLFLTTSQKKKRKKKSAEILPSFAKQFFVVFVPFRAATKREQERAQALKLIGNQGMKCHS
jgi:hypothetical protein